MKTIRFKNYRHYVKTQWRTARRRGAVAYFAAAEIAKICVWMKMNGLYTPWFGLCHGARNGQECDEFSRFFFGLKMVGTDLFPNLKGTSDWNVKSQILQWDFSKPNPAWIGKCDLIYSNSLDHSPLPKRTLKVWIDQLNSNGVLFIQWTEWHVEVSGGDCFGANLQEYMALLNSVGRVVDLIYVHVPYKQHAMQRKGLDTVVIATKKAEE